MNRQNNDKNQGVLFELTVLILCFIYPFAILTKYSIFYVMALLSLYMVAIHFVFRGRLTLPRLSGGFPVYLLFIIMFVSSLWASDPIQSVWKASITLVFLWVFFTSYISSVNNREYFVWRLATILPYICAMLLLIIFIQYGSIRVSSPEMYKSVGSFSNKASAMVSVCIPFLVYLLLTRKKWKTVMIGSLVCCCIVILASQSRGAYLMFGMTIVLITFSFGRSVSSKIAIGSKVSLLILGVSIFFVMIVGYESTVGLVYERFQLSQLGVLVEGGEVVRGKPDYRRTVMYLEGLKVIRAHPIMGVGYNGISPWVEKKYGRSIISHNIFITGWGELGIIGLGCVLWIMIAAIRRRWRLRNHFAMINDREYYFHSAALVAVIVTFLYAQFRPQLTNPMFYVVLGICLAPRGRGSLGIKQLSNG